jgi:hypothetical protein
VIVLIIIGVWVLIGVIVLIRAYRKATRRDDW